MPSSASFEFEFSDLFGTREEVSYASKKKKKRERDTGSIFLEPDILSLKCYINKVNFVNNLETIDIPLFGNK